MFYTYLLRCSDDTLYCGYSNDLKKRVAAHNEKKGAKYTRARLPVTLVYFETYVKKEDAMRREAEIKKMSRAQKMLLCQNFQNKIDDEHSKNTADLPL